MIAKLSHYTFDKNYLIFDNKQRNDWNTSACPCKSRIEISRMKLASYVGADRIKESL